MRAILLGCLLLAPVLGGCSSTPEVAPRPAPLLHLVYFRLQDPSDVGELLADCDELLATIPSVMSYAAAPPFDTGRETVSADYDLCLLVGFETVLDYRAYLEHPAHIQLVDTWRPRLREGDGLTIHDIFDRTP